MTHELTWFLEWNEWSMNDFRHIQMFESKVTDVNLMSGVFFVFSHGLVYHTKEPQVTCTYNIVCPYFTEFWSCNELWYEQYSIVQYIVYGLHFVRDVDKTTFYFKTVRFLFFFAKVIVLTF